MKTSEPANQGPVLFFHICTDGESNGIVHTCDEDYRRATLISAVCAHKNNVRLLCHIHMSTHSHFVAWCSSEENAAAFIEDYKREYSKYLYSERGISSVYRRVKSKPIRINDIRYLKRCIVYVLLNAVSARICFRPEDYTWSSFNAYFNESEIKGILIEELPQAQRRKISHTHSSLKGSGLLADAHGNIVTRSFIDFKLVERLYGSRTDFFKALALTNCVEEELLYVPKTVRYNDTELFTEAKIISARRFNIQDPVSLTKAQRLSIVPSIMKSTGAGIARVARILRLNPSEARSVLGLSDNSSEARPQKK